MGKLIVLQSLWAMERRQTDGLERSLEENVEIVRTQSLRAIAFDLFYDAPSVGEA